MWYMNYQTCCTGHRPKSFPYKYGVDKEKHNVYLQAIKDKIELVIAAFNGTRQGGTWYTIKYAKETNTAIELIDLCVLK